MKTVGLLINSRDRVAQTPHCFCKTATLQQRMRLFEDLVNRDRRHAAMIDRTIAQHAGRTIRRPANDFGVRRQRISSQRIRRAEDYQRRRIQRRADMSRTGIIRNQDVSHADNSRCLSHSCLASQYYRLSLCVFANILRNL